MSTLADHGGHGLTHGSGRPEDMTVPWILAGPGVVPSLRLEAPISDMDSASTAAWALGLAWPAEWDGRAVDHAGERPSATTLRSGDT